MTMTIDTGFSRSRRHRAKVAAAMALLAAAALTGCVSTQGYSGGEASPTEAARFNTQLGVGYMEQGNNDLAMQKLQRALKEDPNLPEAHTSIALLFARLGESRRADRHYRRALELAPDDPSVQNAYGVFLCRHGKAAESEKYFLDAARNPVYPTPEAAYTNAGVCLVKIGRNEQAERYFRSALKSRPDYPDALWQLANLSFSQHKYLETRAFLQRFMAHNVKPHAEVLWLAARNERALGSAPDAARYARELIARFPRSREAERAKQQHYDDSRH